MEVVYYVCSKCGFTHQIPEYWSGYSPEEQVELAHVDIEEGKECEKNMLDLVK